MAVTSQTPINVTEANGLTTVFPYNFLVLDASDLLVRVAGVTKTLNVDYTVSGVGNQGGGNVTFTVAPAFGLTVVRQRVMPYEREQDYQTNGDFAAAEVNADFDRPVMMIQQLAEAIARAIVLPPELAGTSTGLPGPESLKGLRWNALANGLENYTISGFTHPDGSANVGYQPAGAGAFASTVQAKLREVISVKDFGALGNDSNNDLTAIQTAIDYAASLTNGAEVFFPAGVYRMSAGVNVPNSKSITLRGEGDASKLRLVSGAGGPILNCGSGTIFSTRTIIKSLFFQGPSGGTSNGIRLQNCNTARVEDCVFQNQVTGIESNSSFAVEVTGNVFDVCSLYGFVATTACHNAVIERNNFFTCQAQGIRFEVLSDNLVIDNNNFEYCGSNVRLNNCNSVSIRNNYMEYQSNAFFEFLGTCRQVFIESNWCALGTGGGAILSLSNINGGAFRANTIFNQTVSVGTGLVDFEIGANYKTGTGTMPVQNWTAPALLNSWANQANYNPAGYRKDENNVVHLRGNLITGTVGSVAFNLPAGYRPAAFGTYASAGTSGLAACEIRPNGDVFISVAPSNQASLNGISFKAEA